MFSLRRVTGTFAISVAMMAALTMHPSIASAGMSSGTVYAGTSATLIGPDTDIETSLSGYTGSGYIGGFNSSSDEATFTVSVPTTGYYPLTLHYESPYGAKINNILVNGNLFAQLNFPQNSSFQDLSAGNVFLNAGTDTITFQANWGYTYLNSITVGAYLPPTPPPPVSATPVDQYDTGNTLSLMKYLTSIYGTKTLSGQENGVNSELSYIQSVSGKIPAIQSFDLDQPDQMQSVINQAIAWGKAGGIVEISWHWVAPSGGASFNTSGTTFSATQASTPGTTEYTEAMANIQQVAGYLQQLQNAGIPVLFRPLLEADGGWFWWGADGSSAFKNLWSMMYDQMVNTDKLNNLIWVYSISDVSKFSTWYPGNSMTDIVGVDMYNSPGDTSPGTSDFNALENDVNGQKMLALTEAGSVIDEQVASQQSTDWLYWNVWNGKYIMQSKYDLPQNIYDNYNASNVVDFSNLPSSIYGYAPVAPALPPIPTPQPIPSGYTAYYAAGGTLLGSDMYISTTNKGFSGPGYVTGFYSSTDGVQVTVNVATSGLYNLKLRMDSPYGPKTSSLYVNGQQVKTINTPSGNVFQDVDVGTIQLNAGSNTISLKTDTSATNWGYVNMDAFLLEPDMAIWWNAPSTVTVGQPFNLSGTVYMNAPGTVTGSVYDANQTVTGTVYNTGTLNLSGSAVTLGNAQVPISNGTFTVQVTPTASGDITVSGYVYGVTGYVYGTPATIQGSIEIPSVSSPVQSLSAPQYDSVDVTIPLSGATADVVTQTPKATLADGEVIDGVGTYSIVPPTSANNSDAVSVDSTTGTVLVGTDATPGSYRVVYTEGTVATSIVLNVVPHTVTFTSGGSTNGGTPSLPSNTNTESTDGVLSGNQVTFVVNGIQLKYVSGKQISIHKLSAQDKKIPTFQSTGDESLSLVQVSGEGTFDVTNALVFVARNSQWVPESNTGINQSSQTGGSVLMLVEPKKTTNASTRVIQTPMGGKIATAMVVPDPQYPKVKTTYMGVYYLQQTLKSLGINNTWNGHTLNIVDPEIQASSLKPTKSGTGNAQISINGIPVESVEKLVIKDPQDKAVSTSLMPLFYLQQALDMIQQENVWNGEDWLI